MTLIISFKFVNTAKGDITIMLIPLKQWAERVGINPASARQKAGRGKLPAVKVGVIG